MAERPRFLADEMLGSLARWLRIMGYDTGYAKGRDDTAILREARAERRVLLTRDRQLAERAGDGGLLIESDELEEQLAQVTGRYGLKFDEPMTRCALCNGELVLVPRSEVAGKVPPRVLEANEEFLVCRSCGQVYWKGSHWDRIVKQLDRALRGGSGPR
ncbi:Mut7-C RNAse domain-containing protein [Methanomassiliicoccus luminyensis]|jgi:uncharacterized protein with PIN domain|uniref:Mut7-C RNAse domain-containing protein n=1 Tax=Methanomassiliicoccus luminyensis TaxID=1080712 RepID=UPI00037BD095|nr:Mut7-C RNAse domain-containing protein [Methanomassiliicoccus luminyensis]